MRGHTSVARSRNNTKPYRYKRFEIISDEIAALSVRIESMVRETCELHAQRRRLMTEAHVHGNTEAQESLRNLNAALLQWEENIDFLSLVRAQKLKKWVGLLQKRESNDG